LVKFVIPIIAGIALSAPAIAQDAYHVRVGDRLYDIRTGSASDGVLVTGPSRDGLEKVREALVAAGCLRPDEADLSRHDCYINHDGSLVHRPARDSSGRPQGATARFPFILCLRIPDCLPLHVRGCVRPSAYERHNVIFDPAGAGATRQPSGRARVNELELVFDQGRSMLPGRSGD